MGRFFVGPLAPQSGVLRAGPYFNFVRSHLLAQAYRMQDLVLVLVLGLFGLLVCVANSLLEDLYLSDGAQAAEEGRSLGGGDLGTGTDLAEGEGSGGSGGSGGIRS